MTMQQPGRVEYGHGQGYAPSAAYRPQGAPVRRRRRWPFVAGGLVVAVLLGIVGYSWLSYGRSVGLPPVADPVPTECQVSAELLDQIGAASWQSGPLRIDGDVQGVTCHWVAAEAESVRRRQLIVTSDRYPSPEAAAKAMADDVAKLGTQATEQDGVGDDAVVTSDDGRAWLIARRAQDVIAVEVAGADKAFFHGLFGDSVDTPIPAAEARELVIAVGQELFAADGDSDAE